MEFVKRAGEFVNRHYYYFNNKQEQLYKKLLAQPLFEQIITYLLEQPDPVILRRIKERFPETELEKVLEEMVKTGIIARADRRYQVAFPIFTDKDLPVLEARIAELTEEHRQDLARINDCTVNPNMAFERLSALFQEEEAYFFAIESGKLQDLYDERLKRAQIKVGPYVFTTIFTAESDDLVTYFEKLDQRSPLTPKQTKIYRLLGDVNPKYALNQVGRLLTQSGTYKKDIFTDSLRELGIITEVEGETHIAIDTFPIWEEQCMMATEVISYPEITAAERTLCAELTKTAFAKRLTILSDSFGAMFLTYNE